MPPPATDCADRYQPVGGAEPPWLTEVRLRAARRVLWLRHLWAGQQYEGEHLLATRHSEVARALVPPAEAAEAEQVFYRSDERAAAITAHLGALTGRSGDGMLGHLAGTLGLSSADVALFMLTAAAALDPAVARVFGYLLVVTEAADPTPALAATLFELTGPPPGPGSALLRGALAEPVGSGRAALAASDGSRGGA